MRSFKEENGPIRNGENRIASQERIIQLHKRLHQNEKTNENIIDIEPQSIREQPNAKLSRIRKTDVRKYLGDPLPLPYLANPRPRESIQNQNNHQQSQHQQPQHQHINDEEISNDLQKRRKFQLRKPLSKSYQDQSEDQYKEKLRDSLKNFQRSSEAQSKRSVDKTVQTDENEDIPMTPKGSFNRSGFNNSFTSPINFSGSYSQPYKMLVKDLDDKDFIINNFKSRNSNFYLNTPVPTKPVHENSKRLLDPVELTSDMSQKRPSPNHKQQPYYHIRLVSILGSPILLLGLLFLLAYILYEILLQMELYP